MAPKAIARLAPPPPAAAVTVEAQAISIQGAIGATLGELFQYSFASAVTIKRNQSAMPPFLQD